MGMERNLRVQQVLPAGYFFLVCGGISALGGNGTYSGSGAVMTGWLGEVMENPEPISESEKIFTYPACRRRKATPAFGCQLQMKQELVGDGIWKILTTETKRKNQFLRWRNGNNNGNGVNQQATVWIEVEVREDFWGSSGLQRR